MEEDETIVVVQRQRMNEKVLVYLNTEIQLDYGLRASGCITFFIQVTSGIVFFLKTVECLI